MDRADGSWHMPVLGALLFYTTRRPLQHPKNWYHTYWLTSVAWKREHRNHQQDTEREKEKTTVWRMAPEFRTHASLTLHLRRNSYVFHRNHTHTFRETLCGLHYRYPACWMVAAAQNEKKKIWFGFRPDLFIFAGLHSCRCVLESRQLVCLCWLRYWWRTLFDSPPSFHLGDGLHSCTCVCVPSTESGLFLGRMRWLEKKEGVVGILEQLLETR